MPIFDNPLFGDSTALTTTTANQFRERAGSAVSSSASGRIGNVLTNVFWGAIGDNINDVVSGDSPWTDLLGPTRLIAESFPITGDLGNIQTSQLTDSLRVIEMPSNPTPEEAQAVLQLQQAGANVNAEIARRVAENPEIASEVLAQMDRKTEMTEQQTADAVGNLGSALANVASSIGDSIGRSLGLSGSVSANRRLDGRRVSREASEYYYCLQSGEIGSALKAVELWDLGEVSEIVIGSAASFDRYGGNILTIAGFNDLVQDDMSYGVFCDSHQFRCLIAQRRNLRRKVFSANVKCVLQLLDPPLEQDILFGKIFNSQDLGPVIDELRRTLNPNVKRGTNQAIKNQQTSVSSATDLIVEQSGGSSDVVNG